MSSGWAERNIETELPSDVVQLLGSYVYIYIDPRDEEIFYIGKGKGSRLLQHLKEDATSEKGKRVAEILNSGFLPEIEILAYSLSDRDARLIEAAAIDLIGKSQLTNRMSGSYVGSYGRIKLGELMQISNAEPANVTEKALLVTINKLYRSNMSALELYEATRGIWRVGIRRGDAEIVMPVFQGIVREVYRPSVWYPAGTTEYSTRNFQGRHLSKRWEFVGEVDKGLSAKYVGKSVGKGGQNPVRYLNF